MAESVKRLTSAQVTISQFMGSSLTSGSVLTAQSLELALDSVSPSLSLSAPPLLTHSRTVCLSVSRINTKRKRKIIFFNIYSFLRKRERQNMSGGGTEREGDTESEASSRL